MVSKVFLLFFALTRLELIRSDEVNFHCFSKLPMIQDEIFARIAAYTKLAWNQTASNRQNFHIYPILAKIHHYFTLIQLFYESSYDRSSYRDKILEKPYTLGKILAIFRNSSNVRVNVPNALFYDRQHKSWRFLEDLKTYYRTETFEISFDSQNEQSVITAINNWNSRNTRGKYSKKEYSEGIPMDYYFSIFLSFNSCWDTTKNAVTRIETRTRRRRFIPAVPKFNTLDLESIPQEVEIPSFSDKDTLGYYSDAEKKYEALRIPLNEEEFAMVVMLPNPNQTLDIFSNFNASDYRHLLQRINENYEHVDYTIPVINSGMFLINEKGVSINGGKLCDYTVVREVNREYFEHRRFLVDRPFGIIVYHEKTLLVLMYAMVRDPVSDLWPISKFRLRVDMNGEEEDIQYDG